MVMVQQVYVSSLSPSSYLILQKPCLGGITTEPSFRVWCSRPSSFPNQRKQKRFVTYGCRGSRRTIKAVSVSEAENKSVKVKAIITVQRTVSGIFKEMAIERGIDDTRDLLGRSILLELASTQLHPETKLEKETVKGYAHRTHQTAQEVKYEADFEVPDSFGEVGAIFVENEHHREMFIKDIVLQGFLLGPVKFSCKSWVHSKYHNPVKRVFFSNKVSSITSPRPPLFIYI